MAEDQRIQIPMGCAVNVGIINSLANTPIFNHACINMPLVFGIIQPTKGAKWPFFNTSWTMYILYSFFVVPNELYRNLEKTDKFYTLLIDQGLMKGFKIYSEKFSFTEDPLYHFKAFRNSISHCNYNATRAGIRFWDEKKKKGEPSVKHWDVYIEDKNLLDFFVAVGDANLLLYKDIQAGRRDSNGIPK